MASATGCCHALLLLGGVGCTGLLLRKLLPLPCMVHGMVGLQSGTARQFSRQCTGWGQDGKWVRTAGASDQACFLHSAQ